MLHIKLIKSTAGHNPRNRATVKALGLRKVRHVVYHEDTPTIRGMIHHVKFLLEVTEGPAPEKKAAAPKRAAKPAAEAKPKAAPAVEAKATAAVAEPKPKAAAAKAAPKAEAKPKAAAKPKAEPSAKATTKKAKESS